jgi:hypothetical protein
MEGRIAERQQTSPRFFTENSKTKSNDNNTDENPDKPL